MGFLWPLKVIGLCFERLELPLVGRMFIEWVGFGEPGLELRPGRDIPDEGRECALEPLRAFVPDVCTTLNTSDRCLSGSADFLGAWKSMDLPMRWFFIFVFSWRISSGVSVILTLLNPKKYAFFYFLMSQFVPIFLPLRTTLNGFLSIFFEPSVLSSASGSSSSC